MLRLLAAAAIAVFATQFPLAARASSVLYDLTLTPTLGSVGGSGYFDVSAPVNGSGVNALTAFSVTIDGDVFNLGNELGTATATFSGGVLTSLNYLGDLVSTSGGFNLDILGTGGLSYAFVDIGTGATLASGTISAVDPPGATPLPSAVVLFATGLLGLLLLNYRHKRIA
jgi:hypothetical protein